MMHMERIECDVHTIHSPLTHRLSHLSQDGHIFFIFNSIKYIEDIYLFEVNTKYILSSVLKTSEFS